MKTWDNNPYSNQYYSDLTIPENWVCTSYHNDALPSFQSSDNDAEAYTIWVDSWDESIRGRTIYAGVGEALDPLPFRFTVTMCYGFDGSDLFHSDDFESVVQWIKDNPKTKNQIKLTKSYL